MADNDSRWRRDQDYIRNSDDDRNRRRGDVDRDLLDTSRRLEARHDYDPDLIQDMRYFSGAESDREYDAERRRSGRTGLYGDQGPDVGRGERGFFDRTRDGTRSGTGGEDMERHRRTDVSHVSQGAQHHRGRGPRGYARSDERIREDVSDRLTEDPYVDASDIDVAVSDREVTLSGTVDDRRAKRRAEDIAETVSGVTYVQNNLRVRQHGHAATGTGTAEGASTMAGMNTRATDIRYE